MRSEEVANQAAQLIDEIQEALNEMRSAALDGNSDRLANATERWRVQDDRMRALLAEPRSQGLAENLRRALDTIVAPARRELDIDELLESALERLTDVLGVDTAAVLLLDGASQQLIARAAVGVEEEVHQGVHVPVGVGFAGRIAAERRAVILDRVDSTTVSNPLLWEKGIRAMLGVPLADGEKFLGVIHIGTFKDRTFGPVEQHLLELVAERLAPSLSSWDVEGQESAARVLQRSLLPPALPKLATMTFATRYVPADENVGGDWYDAFLLHDGRLWVMAGDITGHGLEAAVVMGRLRSAARAFALHNDDPAAVLELANEKLRFFEPNQYATVLCATSRPPYDTIEIASVGHLPPVVATPDGDPYLVDLQPAPLFGPFEHLGALTTTVPFAPGSVFVAFTDGLVERRGEVITEGLERVRAAVHCEEPETVCRTVMHELVGRSAPRDDVVLLVMRRSTDGGAPSA